MAAIHVVRHSRDLVSYLQENGFQVVYREHEQDHPMASGHFFPREELPNLVDWLSVRHRLPTPHKLTVVRDRDHTGRLHLVAEANRGELHWETVLATDLPRPSRSAGA